MIDDALAALAAHGLTSLPPLGFILGSGLGSLADEAEEAIRIPYAQIPGFPAPSVPGHDGQLTVGRLEGRRVALFKGRGHYYEQGDARAMATAIEAFQRLGGKALFLTNAAGGLHVEWTPPTLAAITDHINFAGVNPLVGYADPARRFTPMTRAYDPELLDKLKRAAAQAGVDLREGVYMWFNGPSFETPAEIRAARVLGADLVGMSTAPEVILARYWGVRCVAASLVTNFAAGLAGGDPSHEETTANAAKGSERFGKLLRSFISLY